MADGTMIDATARLCVERRGSGFPVVLAHGLTATRRYVVHGSRLLERSGFDVLAYDARGHGASDPAPRRSDYEYEVLADDLRAVMDAHSIDRAILVGASMGAATTLRFALGQPDRVAALVQITPAHVGLAADERQLARWDALADALERGGADGFMRAYGPAPVEQRFRGLVQRAIRQRIERHRHPEAVADALRVVPRSIAFHGPDALRALAMPALVVGSRDELDPEHPLEVAERYGQLIPDSTFIVEDEGDSPLAWRGARLSRAIAQFARERDLTLA